MLLDEWERSGGSAAQFADYVGIKYSTLANWIQKRREQAGLQASLLKPGAVNSMMGALQILHFQQQSTAQLVIF
jgi:DNA-binding transcriptional regulator YiaG